MEYLSVFSEYPPCLVEVNNVREGELCLFRKDLPFYLRKTILKFVVGDIDNRLIRLLTREWIYGDKLSVEICHGHISQWDTSRVTNMECLFLNARQFNEPLNGWNTAAVSTMAYMFRGAQTFNQPLDQWQVHRVVDMTSMFQWTRAFNQPLGVWDVSSVQSMARMFRDARAFNQPLEQWGTKTNHVVSMEGMFFRAMSFDQPLGGWGTASLETVREMFYDALQVIDLSPSGLYLSFNQVKICLCAHVF